MPQILNSFSEAKKIDDIEIEGRLEVTRGWEGEGGGEREREAGQQGICSNVL
jgi:hypothetical protein